MIKIDNISDKGREVNHDTAIEVINSVELQDFTVDAADRLYDRILGGEMGNVLQEVEFYMVSDISGK